MNEIFEKTILIAKNPSLRDQMGSNGRNLAIEHFSVKAMISKHEEIYSQLMGRLN
jgi:glycosyltransferase involved in cell wall biosynthesis